MGVPEAASVSSFSTSRSATATLIRRRDDGSRAHVDAGTRFGRDWPPLVDPLLRHLDGVGVSARSVAYITPSGAATMLVDATALVDAHECLGTPAGAVQRGSSAMFRPSIQPRSYSPCRKASKALLLSGSPGDPPLNLPTL